MTLRFTVYRQQEMVCSNFFLKTAGEMKFKNIHSDFHYSSLKIGARNRYISGLLKSFRVQSLFIYIYIYNSDESIGYTLHGYSFTCVCVHVSQSTSPTLYFI